MLPHPALLDVPRGAVRVAATEYVVYRDQPNRLGCVFRDQGRDVILEFGSAAPGGIWGMVSIVGAASALFTDTCSLRPGVREVAERALIDLHDRFGLVVPEPPARPETLEPREPRPSPPARPPYRLRSGSWAKTRFRVHVGLLGVADALGEWEIDESPQEEFLLVPVRRSGPYVELLKSSPPEGEADAPILELQPRTPYSLARQRGVSAGAAKVLISDVLEFLAVADDQPGEDERRGGTTRVADHETLSRAIWRSQRRWAADKSSLHLPPLFPVREPRITIVSGGLPTLGKRR